MADFGFDEVHVAVVALILLEGGDLFGIGGPEDDGAVAVDPSGVVGGVAKIFYAVVGELGFLAGGEVADPEVPVANEDGAVAVGRGCGVLQGVGGVGVLRRAGCAGAVAEIVLACDGDDDGVAIGGEFDGEKRQRVRIEGVAGERTERGCEFGVIEGGLLGAGGGVDEHEL